MTVFEYLKVLPQELFESVLLGLMGLHPNTEGHDLLHNWLNQPYEEYFPVDNPSVAAGNLSAAADHMLLLLGKTASTLPADQQEKLKNAMKDYCEVCDYVNNRLSNQ